MSQSQLDPHGLSVVDRSPPQFTHREIKYMSRIVFDDMTPRQALFAIGFGVGIAEHPERFVRPEMIAEMARMQADLVSAVRERGLITATEILEHLTDEIRLDRREFLRPDGGPKPLNQLPEAAGRLIDGFDFEEEIESVRSHDGEDTEGRGGWESGNKIVRKTKLKLTPRAKLLELAMKHRGVNAMVESKSPDVHVHLHAEITSRLQGALARRESRLIETTATRIDDTSE